jgi:hypothetical protein
VGCAPKNIGTESNQRPICRDSSARSHDRLVIGWGHDDRRSLQDYANCTALHLLIPRRAPRGGCRSSPAAHPRQRSACASSATKQPQPKPEPREASRHSRGRIASSDTTTAAGAVARADGMTAGASAVTKFPTSPSSGARQQATQTPSGSAAARRSATACRSAAAARSTAACRSAAATRSIAATRSAATARSATAGYSAAAANPTVSIGSAAATRTRRTALRGGTATGGRTAAARYPAVSSRCRASATVGSPGPADDNLQHAGTVRRHGHGVGSGKATLVGFGPQVSHRGGAGQSYFGEVDGNTRCRSVPVQQGNCFGVSIGWPNGLHQTSSPLVALILVP